ncbi:acyl-CoA dehydrogenase family protein [Bacillus bombysepticus]
MSFTLSIKRFSDKINQIIDNEHDKSLYDELLAVEQELSKKLDVSNVSLGIKVDDTFLFLDGLAEGVIFYLDNNVWYKVLYHESIPISNKCSYSLTLRKVENYTKIAQASTQEQKILWLYGLHYKLILASYVLKSIKNVLQLCKEYVKERKTFGVSIAKHQMVYDTFVTVSSEFEGNVLFLRELSDQIDSNGLEYQKYFKQINFMLENNSELADRVLPLFGAYGLENNSIIDSFLNIHHLSILKGV